MLCSPPPPPPMEMSAYQDLVDDDPEGFIEVRRRLESFFPKLSHVATSSMGASIAGHIADFTVTPMALTRAFLSSRGMDPDSLGARVVESRHTGTSPEPYSNLTPNPLEPCSNSAYDKWNCCVCWQAAGATRVRRCTSTLPRTVPRPLDASARRTLRVWRTSIRHTVASGTAT